MNKEKTIILFTKFLNDTKKRYLSIYLSAKRENYSIHIRNNSTTIYLMKKEGKFYIMVTGNKTKVHEFPLTENEFLTYKKLYREILNP